MDRPLLRVRDSLDDFFSEQARRAWAQASGAKPPSENAPGWDTLPELYAPETFAAAQEARARALVRQEPRTAQRLDRVMELVARCVEEREGHATRQAIENHERLGVVSLDTQSLAFSSAWDELGTEHKRERRHSLARSLGHFFWDARGLYGGQVEAAQRSAEALHAESYPALRERVEGFALGPLLEQSAALLRDTEDAYRDLLAYALRKMDSIQRPLPHGTAQRHDLELCLSAPAFAGFFPGQEGKSLLQRWLAESGLALPALQRLKLDDEPRPGKARAPRVFAPQVPGPVHLSWTPLNGLEPFTLLLHATRDALAWASVEEAAPVEFKRLQDPALMLGQGFLFEQMLQDPAWLRRYLGLSPVDAAHIARWASFRALAQLRSRAALLASEVSLYRKGSSEERAEEYAAGQRRALFVEPAASFFFKERPRPWITPGQLRGAALAARLHTHLTTRFNEDFWRNPEAGQWLSNEWAQGGAGATEALAERLSPLPLTLKEAGSRLVGALNN